LDLDSGDLADMTEPQDGHDLPRDRHPDWSPDGTRIVYDSLRDREFWLRQPGDPAGAALSADLHVMTADGAHVANLTKSKEHEFEPSWSPDGDAIVFLRQLNDGGPAAVFVLDVNTGRERRLTDGATTAWDPSWSPDGTRVVFAAVEWRKAVFGSRNIYAIDRSGANLTQLTHYEDGMALDPRWFDPGLGVLPAGKLGRTWGELKR